MAENGMVSETLADTLMGYGYMQRGVRKVELQIDFDLDNNSQRPKVSYVLRLQPRLYRRYLRMSSLVKTGGLWSKLVLFFYMKLGTPFPGSIEDNVHYLAREMLPGNYTVNVDVQRA